MERDFFGLNSKNSAEMVEGGMIKDGWKDNVFRRSSGMQWPYSNKVPMLPQFIPFQAVQPISTADASKTNHRTFNGVVQNNLTPNRKGSMQYAMTASPVQPVDAQSPYHPPDMRMFSVSNNTNSVSMNSPFFNTPVTTTNHNKFMKQHSIGRIPVTAPHFFVPSPGSMAGTAERNVSKPSGSHAQLTIFYGCSVNVYDDISPEKAQGIMFLAANGSSVNPNMKNPKAHIQAPIPKPLEGDDVHGNQSHTASPCSGLSSPTSVTSHTAAQSGSGGYSGTEEVMEAKPKSALIALRSQPSACQMSTDVPQARRVSLVRFLEQRKERVMKTVPYYMSKRSPDRCVTLGSSTLRFCGNTVAGSVPTNMDHSWCFGSAMNASNNENLQTTLKI